MGGGAAIKGNAEVLPGQKGQGFGQSRGTEEAAGMCAFRNLHFIILNSILLLLNLDLF